MKNVILAFLATAGLLAGSCNRIDTELVGKIQSTINSEKENKVALESNAAKVTDLYQQMSSAPGELHTSTTSRFPELFSMVEGIKQRYDQFLIIHTHGMQSLDSLLGEYTDGKIKKEDALAGFEAVNEELTNLKASDTQTIGIFEKIAPEASASLAEWKANPEAVQSGPTALSAAGAAAAAPRQQSADTKAQSSDDQKKQ